MIVSNQYNTITNLRIKTILYIYDDEKHRYQIRQLKAIFRILLEIGLYFHSIGI